MAEKPNEQRVAADIVGELEARIAKQDRAGAVTLAIDAVHGERISIADLYTLVLGPFLAGIGTAWQHGTERVWQEHLASHAVATIIEALYLDVVREADKVPRLGQRVVLACPPKEQHEMGLRMLADRFELAGYDATFLGADTPLAEIASAAKETGASLICLSVSTIYERVELRNFIDTLRSEVPSCRIVVGGPAFARDRDWPAEDLLDAAEFSLPGAIPGA